ncbi:MAG: putative lipid II flippase FtsW [Candidatus Blackburnbacteria bacterium]|nr:putative lipid II flippase FtsW [Candidatus Blackburnbacteria bacterium]
MKPQVNRIDRPFLIALLLLVFFGVAMVFDASAADGARSFNDKFFYVKRQVLWISIGMVVMFVFSRIKYSFWEKTAVPFLLLALVLLVLVLIPGLGIEALGARRRMSLGSIGIQPSELAKLAMSIFLSASLSRSTTVIRFLVPLVLVCSLVVVEPDLGTTTIIAGMGFLVYFTSGAPIFHFVSLGGGAGLLALILAFTSSYRRERIMTFLNPHVDPVNTSYHIRQVLIALGSGGIFGLGLGQSRQKQLFLPEPATDSIFAIIAEELGFLGSVLVLVLFMFLIWRGFAIAARAQDQFGRLLAVAITSWIAIQTIINLSAMVALVPLTGIPLPFVSYGGSSLIVLLGAVGILLNISKYCRK